LEPGLASFPGSGWSYGRHAGCLVLLRRWTTPHSRARQHGSVADVPAWLVSWTNGVMRTPPGLTAGSRAPTPLQQPEAAVRSIDSTQCGLCGATLSARTLRYHVLSPHRADARLTLCLTCRKVALGEGYWPVD